MLQTNGPWMLAAGWPPEGSWGVQWGWGVFVGQAKGSWSGGFVGEVKGCCGLVRCARASCEGSAAAPFLSSHPPGVRQSRASGARGPCWRGDEAVVCCRLHGPDRPPSVQSARPGLRHGRLRHQHCHGYHHPGFLRGAVLRHPACLPSLWAAATCGHSPEVTLCFCFS